MKENRKLSIVIVTFESENIIKTCLKKIDFLKNDVFVVDNNSKDNTTKIVQKEFPEVNLIKLNQNSGFSRANNAALEKVNTPYSLILNPDAFINQKDIDKILNIMDKNNDFAIASAPMYQWNVNKKIENAQIIEQSLGTKIGEDKNTFYVKFISGAGMFLNMSIFKELGFFDKNFFLYCEDNEICKRSLKKGYKNALIKNTKLYHQSGGSSKRSDELSKKIIWHKFGWSKAYYTQAVHGVIVGKLKSIRVLLKYSFLILKDLITKSKIDITHKYTFLGNFSYLIGLRAFRKDGQAR